MAYLFVTRTGTIGGSGTDAQTLVRFIGTQGVSPSRTQMWNLNNSGDDMENGDTDRYRIPMEPIGNIQRLEFWFDPGNVPNNSWFCEYMELFSPSGVSLRRWIINRWFTRRGLYIFPEAPAPFAANEEVLDAKDSFPVESPSEAASEDVPAGSNLK